MSGETFGQALRRLRRERGLSLRKLQVLTRYDFTYLGQIERGEKPGSLDVASTCDRALGLAGKLIEIYRRPSEPNARTAFEEDDMRRRTAIRMLASTPLVFAARPGGIEVEVVRLERGVGIYRHLYHSAGDPRDLLGLARDHLDGTLGLLRQLSDGRLKQRVLRNRSEVATLAGRLAFFDLHDATGARGYYGLAYEAATQASDEALSAAAVGHLAFVPAHEGNVPAALDYLGAALAHARRTGVPALGSWIAAVESELLAGSDPAAGLRALERAESMLATPPGEAPPAWFDYYSTGRLNGFRGYALLKAGRGEQARKSLTAALGGLAANAVKQRAVFLLDIASSHLIDKAPDVEQACRLGADADNNLKLAGYATGSQRLREFRARLRPWDDTRAVRNLDERLG